MKITNIIDFKQEDMISALILTGLTIIGLILYS